MDTYCERLEAGKKLDKGSSAEDLLVIHQADVLREHDVVGLLEPNAAGRSSTRCTTVAVAATAHITTHRAARALAWTLQAAFHMM